MNRLRYILATLIILGVVSSCKEKKPQAPWDTKRVRYEETQEIEPQQEQEQPPADETQQREDLYLVSHVVDGDTFDVIKDGVKTRVRLVGVDTPESVHPDKEVEHFALEASDFLKKILLNQEVYFTFDQNNAATNHTDRYGRTLAYAYRARDGLLINAHLIKEGYGYAYLNYPFENMEAYLGYQREAREAGKGLWGASSQTPAADAVYWFNAGSNKYHLKSCRYVKENSMTIPLADALANGLEACKVCKP